MLIAAVSVFDEIDFISGCIESLEVADRIVVVDGAFAGFPHRAASSTDGTLEWLEAAARTDGRIEVIPARGVWADEVAKRNAYLLGHDGDFYLVVDADERLYGGPELIDFLRHAPLDSYAMPLFDRPWDRAPIPAGRLFKHLPGVRYEVGDGRVVCDSKALVSADTAEGTVPWREGVPGPRLMHLAHRRSAQRNAAREAYMRHVIEQDPELAADVARSGVDVIEAWRARHKHRPGGC